MLSGRGGAMNSAASSEGARARKPEEPEMENTLVATAATQTPRCSF